MSNCSETYYITNGSMILLATCCARREIGREKKKIRKKTDVSMSKQSPGSWRRTGNIDRVMECYALILLHCPHLSALEFVFWRRKALAFLEAFGRFD